MVMQVQEKILELLYTINEDVVSIKNDMSEVKQEINVLKEDMSEVKQEMTVMKEECRK
ncbi:hypothetical protein QKY_1994 [Clostridioides difficile DA00211]|nr:hypothetical protein QKY_1994 [Clostridioides difficile DA00211]